MALHNKDKQPSFSEKLKEGVSVHEIETFARKYTTELFLVLGIIIATISSMFDFFTGAGWSLLVGGIGAIGGIVFYEMVEKFQMKIFAFLGKQEKVMQIVIGVVRILVALFIPFVIFAEMGILSGLGFHQYMKKIQQK